MDNRPSSSNDRIIENPFVLCPICHRSTKSRFAIHGYSLYECLGCKHQFFRIIAQKDHVAHVYGDSYFTDGGAGYPDYLSESRLLRNRGRWYASQLSRYRPVGTVLDIGAAAGFVLQGLQDAGWRGQGIEPNEKMARYAREVLGLSVLTTDLESFDCDQQFDLVSMIQVIAHFVDPRLSLEKAVRVLKPGGYLLIETWDSQSITARLLGKRWHEYSPPSVLHCFSLDSLYYLTSEIGFREVARGRPSKWISAPHAKELIRQKFSGSKWMERLMLSLPESVNFPYLAEDLVYVILGKIY